MSCEDELDEWCVDVAPNELMGQAVDTAARYMVDAVEKIDQQFGKGYAKDHPELVGRFMATCAAGFRRTFQAKVDIENNKWVTAALFDVAKALRLLGNGNIDRGDLAPGAIEGLVMMYRDKAEEIVSAIDGVGSSLDRLAEAVRGDEVSCE